MEKQKKKLTISGKPKNTFISQKNFETKKRFPLNDKKFSKPITKTSNSFKKNFKTKPITSKLSDYERRKLAEQKATKVIRGENNQKDKENLEKFQSQQLDLR